MAITKKPIHDITAQNLSQVPASRGGNPIQWIVIHYLGVQNADNPNLYGGGYGGHYYVSRAGEIYKAANPHTAVVWQCGGGLQGSSGHQYFGQCTNYNSIGIENGVCYDNDWYFTTETQESLVYLVSTLMDEYGIDINHVIRHYDVTGKNCPAPYVANNKHRTSWTWDQFKAKLKAYRSGDSGVTTTYSFKTPQIKQGDTGNVVYLLQRLLKSRGMYKGLDKIYSAKVTAAVKTYQKWISTHGGNLKVDGICGPATWESILGISGTTKTVKQVKQGDKGIEVYIVKELLIATKFYTGSLDKTFGSDLTAAVKEYQKKKKLVIDGVVGPKTWQSLIKL